MLSCLKDVGVVRWSSSETRSQRTQGATGVITPELSNELEVYNMIQVALKTLLGSSGAPLVETQLLSLRSLDRDLVQVIVAVPNESVVCFIVYSYGYRYQIHARAAFALVSSYNGFLCRIQVEQASPHLWGLDV